jgi:DNA-binding FrmR family transcriptional regulator
MNTKVKTKSCHHKELVKLARIKGQIEGISRMIEDLRYCPDILMQIKAAKKALAAVENNILKTHLEHCVTDAMKSRSEKEINEKIEELLKVLS